MDTASPSAGVNDLPNYGAMLSRRKWLILTCVLLGLALAAGFTALESKTYTATTSVLVRPVGPAVVASNPTSSAAAKTGINLDTEAQLVKSEGVTAAAGKLLKSDVTARQLAKNITVTVPPNTTVLDISYDAGTARGAANGAQAVATAYLRYRSADEANSIKLQRTIIQQQVNQLQVQLQAATAKVAALPSNSPDRALAQANQSALVSQIATQQTQVAALAAPVTDVGNVVNAAIVPSRPSSPVLLLNLAGGLMLGLLVGLALALFRERADHRIRRGSDIEGSIGLPVLAEIGKVGRRRGAPVATEAGYQQLRNVLLTSRRGAGTKVVLVAPASTGSSGGAVALNLAASLLRAGQRVVLVATTPGSAAVQALGLDDSRGICDVVQGDRELSDVLQRPAAFPDLHVVASGRAGGDELLATEAFETVVKRLRQVADVVVIEGGPAATSADTQAVAPIADVVVIVAQVKHTTWDNLAETRRQMELVGTAVLGVVLVHSTATFQLSGAEVVTSDSTPREPVGSTFQS